MWSGEYGLAAVVKDGVCVLCDGHSMMVAQRVWGVARQRSLRVGMGTLCAARHAWLQNDRKCTHRGDRM